MSKLNKKTNFEKGRRSPDPKEMLRLETTPAMDATHNKPPTTIDRSHSGRPSPRTLGAVAIVKFLSNPPNLDDSIQQARKMGFSAVCHRNTLFSTSSTTTPPAPPNSPSGHKDTPYQK